MVEKPHITYIKRLCALEERRMEGRLVRAYSRINEKVSHWLRKNCRITLQDAEDVSTRVWMELVQAVRSRRLREWSDGIVYHVAKNRFRDHYAKQRKRERLIQKGKTECHESDLDTQILIQGLLVSLPGDERAVIESMYVDGRTLAETASELKMSVSSVKRLQSRALAWMRSRVE